MRYTKKVKQEIEAALLQAQDILFAAQRKTDATISVMVGNWHTENDVSIFFHDKKGAVCINSRDEISGFFDSKKWKNRKPVKTK